MLVACVELPVVLHVIDLCPRLLLAYQQAVHGLCIIALSIPVPAQHLMFWL